VPGARSAFLEIGDASIVKATAHPAIRPTRSSVATAGTEVLSLPAGPTVRVRSRDLILRTTRRAARSRRAACDIERKANRRTVTRSARRRPSHRGWKSPRSSSMVMRRSRQQGHLARPPAWQRSSAETRRTVCPTPFSIHMRDSNVTEPHAIPTHKRMRPELKRFELRVAGRHESPTRPAC